MPLMSMEPMSMELMSCPMEPIGIAPIPPPAEPEAVGATADCASENPHGALLGPDHERHDQRQPAFPGRHIRSRHRPLTRTRPAVPTRAQRSPTS